MAINRGTQNWPADLYARDAHLITNAENLLQQMRVVADKMVALAAPSPRGGK